jgi:hypothetical protein
MGASFCLYYLSLSVGALYQEWDRVTCAREKQPNLVGLCTLLKGRVVLVGSRSAASLGVAIQPSWRCCELGICCSTVPVSVFTCIQYKSLVLLCQGEAVRFVRHIAVVRVRPPSFEICASLLDVLRILQPVGMTASQCASVYPLSVLRS